MTASALDRADDYAVVTGETLCIERLLPGPVDRVWAFLTDPQKRGLWLAAGPMELRVGGRVSLTFRNDDLSRPAERGQAGCPAEMHLEGRVTAIEEPFLLSYTWGEGGPDPSEVTFELTPEGDKVRLVVTHRRLAGRGLRLNVSAGWHAHLAILEARLSEREPESFWGLHARLKADYDRRVP